MAEANDEWEEATPAILVLEDGTVFEGEAFGAATKAPGEIVFNTSMSGYQEILTDPSYAGQIVTLTVPHIGNYGTSPIDMESQKIQAAGLVVRAISRAPSSWRSTQPLDEWLAEQGVPGIAGVDTRALTRHIRDRGVMAALIVHDAGREDAGRWLEELAESPDYGDVDWVERVRSAEAVTARLEDDQTVSFQPLQPKSKTRVVVLDFGVKHSIVRNLLTRGLDVVLAPSETTIEEVRALEPDGVLVSNGPGDPALLDDATALVGSLANVFPTWGICLGHQLLARTFGAKTFKLPFGHRGPNQPVHDLESGKVIITSQNHGYAVDADSVPDTLEVTQINLNDGTVEAFRHRTKPVVAVQYHPEAGPGPHDAESFFDAFAASVGHRP